MGAIAKMTMSERLQAWKESKQKRSGKGESKSPSGGGDSKKLYERLSAASKAFDSAISPDSDQNKDPNNRCQQQQGGSSSKVAFAENNNIVAKKATKPTKSSSGRRSVGSLDGKHSSPISTKNTNSSGSGNRSSSDTVTWGEQQQQQRRRSSLGSESKRESNAAAAVGGSSSSSSSSRRLSGDGDNSNNNSKKTTTKKRLSVGGSPKSVLSRRHKEAIDVASAEIAQLKEQLASANSAREEAETKCASIEQQMVSTWGEVKAQFFQNGLLEQEIAGLHGELSTQQLDQSEEAFSVRRKHKQEKKRLEAENREMKSMASELADQMETLQTMFQARLNEMEERLADKQRETDELAQQVSGMKLREVQSKLAVAVAERQVSDMKLTQQAHAQGRRGSRGSSGSSGGEGRVSVGSDEDGHDDGYDTE